MKSADIAVPAGVFGDKIMPDSKNHLTALLLGVKIASSELEGYPSGQRDQTVNLTALPPKVRILLPPPQAPLLVLLSIVLRAMVLRV